MSLPIIALNIKSSCVSISFQSVDQVCLMGTEILKSTYCISICLLHNILYFFLDIVKNPCFNLCSRICKLMSISDLCVIRIEKMNNKKIKKEVS